MSSVIIHTVWFHVSDFYASTNCVPRYNWNVCLFSLLIRLISLSKLYHRGALATFATEGSLFPFLPYISALIIYPTAVGFSAAFPGVKPHLLTLTTNFNMPFYRDILLALGVCSVSKQSCSNILKAGPGYAITIVVGGAAESLSARPGTADLTLRKR